MKRKNPPDLNRLREVFDFKKETGKFIYKSNLGTRGRKGKIAGFKRSDGYWSIAMDGKCWLGHHLAWFYVYGEWVLEIDHDDGIRHHNWIKNLRPCTRVQNNGNGLGWGKKKKSGLPRGVFYHPNDKSRYRAQIYVNRKAVHLGVFNTIKEAKKAYLEAALSYFGDFVSKDL